MSLPFYPIDRLLPHAHPMILLDRIAERMPDATVTELAIRPGLPFFQAPRGIAAHIALEWMAQTCGVHVGAMATDQEQGVKIGFLLGTRDFKSEIDWYKPGQRALVRAQLVFHEAETAVFDCQVTLDGVLVATAQLTVYQPSDMAAMLADQGIAPENAASIGSK